MTDLITDGLIMVHGNDANQYLQGQITADIRELTAQSSLLSCICNAKGRIQSIFRLYNWNNRYYLRMNQTILPLIVTRLKKYAVFSKLTITDVSCDLSILGLSIKGEMSEFNAQYQKLLEPFDYYIYAIDSKRFELCTLKDNLPAIKETLKSLGNISHIRLMDWQLADIQAGLATIDQESFERFLPHELNLNRLGALRFNKGCYVGQEIITRMHYLGKLKQHLHLLKLDQTSSQLRPIKPGIPIVTTLDHHQACNQTAGEVVDSCQNYLLAIIRDQYLNHSLHLQQPPITLTLIR